MEEQKKVMLGRPKDADRFADSVRKGIQNFNENWGKKNNLMLITRDWEIDTISAAGNAQEEILKQIGNCDILIAFYYLSPGSANATDKPGTMVEIDTFKKNGKQVFIFLYNGDVNIKADELPEKGAMRDNLSKYKSNWYYKEYSNDDEICKLTENQLQLYFKDYYKETESASIVDPDENFRGLVKEHLELLDSWLELGNNFSFAKESRELISAMKEDGSVSYYLDAAQRYRTTPAATTLMALDAAKLLPIEVRNRMQDWIFKSKNDKADPGDSEQNGIYKGHEPHKEDQDGWSLNEGVSVWTTGKTLEALLSTDYYRREDVSNDKDIKDATYNALKWLVQQQYDDGGWGFQKHNDDCCKSCVTMTALILKVFALFINQKGLFNVRSGKWQSLYREMEASHEKGSQYMTMKTIGYNLTGSNPQQLVTATSIDHSEVIFWKYDDKISVTASVWVLDWLNKCGYIRVPLSTKDNKKRIIAGILSKLPENETEFAEYEEEVYFKGGKTKYKDITEYRKFYSYMPYHAKVLLEAGTPVADKRIVNIIKNLINSTCENWRGTEIARGKSEKMSFIHAMALSTIAVWLRYASADSYHRFKVEISSLSSKKEFSDDKMNRMVTNVREELDRVEGNNENHR